jgi:glycosyltransferase involved in cell wall biosynthesis
MKILFINYTDSQETGGTIVMYNLLNLLKKRGIMIDLFTPNSPSSPLLKKYLTYSKFLLLRKLFNKYLKYLKKITRRFYSYSNTYYHAFAKETILDIKKINLSDYDIVHFHCIDHVISIEDISKITKPIVWTLHDSWFFCGSEGHPDIFQSDLRYKTGYSKFNKPISAKGIDIDRITWRRKIKSWKNCNFFIISPSSFEKKLLANSAIGNIIKYSCIVIPNVINEDIYHPINKQMLKEIFQIPDNKKIIGFAAAYNITKRKTLKGAYLLFNILNNFDSDNFFFLCIGPKSNDLEKNIKLPCFFTGKIENPYIMACMYNLCDVFVCPSLLENLPSVCIESSFCGTPVAAFRTGGMSDIIEHKETGYLANIFDADDLFNGILFCLKYHLKLSENAIIKMKRNFNNTSIIEKHIEFYNQIIQKKQ